MDPALWEWLRAEAGADGDRELEAIIRLARPESEIPDVRIVSRFGTIATCRIRARDIVPVRARRDVVSLKAARGLSPGFEPATGAAVPDALPRVDFRPADVRRSPRLTLTGKGVVVASVDWGVDVDSAAFRWAVGPAAAGGDRPVGGTRFLSFWDQRDLAAGPRPDPYGYGTVHDREQIDGALRDPRPYERLGYHPAIADRGGHGTHGTHVLDIAAGNGQAGGPAGIAPEADLIFVHLADRTTGGLANLGDSVRLLEAVDFISRTAGSQPCVINISAGRTAGPKDGTTLVERALDELLAATPGRFVVNSAGNYFGWRTHSCGRVAPGESRSLTFVTDPADITPNELEIWYDGADEFTVRIDPPGYAGGRAVRLGERSDLLIEGRTVGRVYHRKRDPNNGDNHIVAYIDPIGPAGNWTVTLDARQVKSGRFHAWIERDDTCPGCQARFTPADSNPVTTIGTITTSRLPLIVGAYDGHDPAQPVAPFSSSGPSRDLRPKPDLVAPGVDVLAARSASIVDSHNPGLRVRKSGTSMATPHVTGAVALCLEAAGNELSARQIRSLVLGSCDPARAPDAPYRFGHGYLNIPRLIADLQRTLTAPSAKEPTMNTDDSIVPLAAAPAAAYRESLYRPHGHLARWIDERFDVVARPGQRIYQAPQVGDVLLEVTLGRVRPGRCLVLKANDPELEVSPRRLPAGQLLLRPRKRAEMSEPLPVEPTAETEGSNPVADVAAGAPPAAAAAPPPTRIDGIDLNTRHVFPPIADLKADGIQFAMLKATEGGTFHDADFYNRRTTARAENFLSGPYHYYRGDAAMLPQADNFVTRVARLLPGDLPPAFDFEKGRSRPTTQHGDGAAAAGLLGAQWLAPLESFLDRVETGLGRTPMMYTSRQVWRDYVRDDPAFARFGDYPLWVKYQQDPATDRYARRLTLSPRLPAPWNDWAIWQYSLDYTPSNLKNLHKADSITDLDVSNGGIHVLRGLANLGRPAPHGNGVRFVAHADENGVINLLTSVGIWLESSLSDLAQSGGTARPRAAGDVTACDLGDRQFVAFRERNDRHLYEIERQNGAFSVVDITSVTGTTNAAGDPTYVTSGSDRHLVCRGDDDHQYLFSNIANRAWQARDVTAGARIANASGQATAYMFGGDIHVVGRAGADGHLVEAWHDGTAWNVVDRTTAGVPAATYQPSTYLGTDGFVRVVYRAVRGAIHESDHHVTDLDLAQAAGGAPTAVGSPVSVMAGQAPHIIYRRPDGFLHEIFWNGAAWAHGQLPCQERAVADPAALVTTEAGAPVLVVTFRRQDGAMQEVALRGGAWRCEAIEPVANKPPADSDPADGDAPPWTGSPEPVPDGDARTNPSGEKPAASERWTGDLVSSFAAAPTAWPSASAGTASYVAGGPAFSVEDELDSWAGTLAGLPAQVRDAFRDGAESLAVKLLIAGGARDEPWLTDVVFHARHPELGGRAIRPGEHALADQWKAIRGGLVRPALQAARAPQAPGPARPPLSSAPAQPPRGPSRSVANWLARALQSAGIDPAQWRSGDGFERNRLIVERVYSYYAGLFNRDENLLWAGMAKLAGGEVYSALNLAQVYIDSNRHSFDPDWLEAMLANYARVLQEALLGAQKAIFWDLAWQHQAFVEGGVAELETARAAGAGVPIDAWRGIASGDPGRIRHGNRALLLREQQVILAPFYQAIRDIPDFDQIPAQMSLAARSPIPGGKSFHAVVPDGDITVFTDRWKWIETDMLPKYEQLTLARRHQLVNTPLADLAEHRWPAP